MEMTKRRRSWLSPDSNIIGFWGRCPTKTQFHASQFMTNLLQLAAVPGRYVFTIFSEIFKPLMYSLNIVVGLIGHCCFSDREKTQMCHFSNLCWTVGFLHSQLCQWFDRLYYGCWLQWIQLHRNTANIRPFSRNQRGFHNQGKSKVCRGREAAEVIWKRILWKI